MQGFTIENGLVTDPAIFSEAEKHGCVSEHPLSASS
jgi:hypothetical protein